MCASASASATCTARSRACWVFTGPRSSAGGRRALHELVGEVDAAIVVTDIEERGDVRMGAMPPRVHRRAAGGGNANHGCRRVAASAPSAPPWCRAHDRLLAQSAFTDSFEQVVMRDNRCQSRTPLTISAASTGAARRGSAGFVVASAADRSPLAPRRRVGLSRPPFSTPRPLNPRGDRAGQHVADADVVVADFLHQCLWRRR